MPIISYLISNFYQLTMYGILEDPIVRLSLFIIVTLSLCVRDRLLLFAVWVSSAESFPSSDFLSTRPARWLVPMASAQWLWCCSPALHKQMQASDKASNMRTKIAIPFSVFPTSFSGDINSKKHLKISGGPKLKFQLFMQFLSLTLAFYKLPSKSQILSPLVILMATSSLGKFIAAIKFHSL